METKLKNIFLNKNNFMELLMLSIYSTGWLNLIKINIHRFTYENNCSTL
jgi:hypothetical protein